MRVGLTKLSLSLCCLVVFFLFTANVLAHHHDFSPEPTYHASCFVCQAVSGSGAFISPSSLASTSFDLGPIGLVAVVKSLENSQRLFLPVFPRAPPCTLGLI